MQNGKCGYVLKPKYMRAPTSPAPGAKQQVHKLSIKLISGQQLVNSEGKVADKGDLIDPFVVIEIIGHPLDQQKVKSAIQRRVHLFTTSLFFFFFFCTHMTFADRNGFNPQWNEKFSWTIEYWDFAMLKIMVYAADGTSKSEIGHYICPVNSIRAGYRRVPLWNRRV